MDIRFLSTLLMKPQRSGLYHLPNKFIKLSGICDLSVPRTWDFINSVLSHLLTEEILLANLSCIGLVKELQQQK